MPAAGLRDGPYPVKAARDGMPVLDAGRFGAGSHPGTLMVIKSGTMTLSPVHCHSISPDQAGVARLQRVDAEAMPIQRPIGMPDRGPGFPPAVTYPDLSITRLHDAICLPGGLVIHDDALLLESFSARWEAVRHRHLREGPELWHLCDPAPVGGRIEGPVLYLDHQHIDWFGHVLLDLLTPGWAYEYGLAYLGLQRLRVLCSAPRHGFVRRLVAALGVPEGDIVWIDRPVRCDMLLVATKALQIQDYVTPAAVRLWHGMRNRIVPPRDQVPSRLFVSRRANPTRVLVEQEAIEALFAEAGFTIVIPERLDIDTQIRLFAGARLIAGCSGSNMFNIAFQARAGAILVLVSPLLVHYSEQFLTSFRPGTQLDMVMGFVDDAELQARPGYVHADWHLDVALMREVLSAWLAGRA